MRGLGVIFYDYRSRYPKELLNRMTMFHVIVAEMSDELTRQINQWMMDREKQSPVSFRLVRWQVTHNGDMTYWTAEYTI